MITKGTDKNDLMLDGWNIYRFSLDAIKERPQKCQQLVLQVMGKLYGGGSMEEELKLSLKQREIMRYAFQIQRPFTPQEVCVQLDVKGQHARELLQQLVRAQLLAPLSVSIRIRAYTLGPKAMQWLKNNAAR